MAKTLKFKTSKNRKPIDDQTARDAYDLWIKHGKNATKAAKAAGVARNTFCDWLAKAEKLRRIEAGETAIPATAPGTLTMPAVHLIDEVEDLAKCVAFKMKNNLERPRMFTALGQRLHVLVEDLRTLEGRPSVIMRSENVNVGTGLDFSKLTPEKLIDLADTIRKMTPGSNIEYSDGVPVILEGVEDTPNDGE